ncbi:MAG: sodium:proton antiporter [Planctomycetes bacterium]|nr:sodium:proton antiporter [Planctomycetota bacterium]
MTTLANRWKSPSLWVFVVAAIAAIAVDRYVAPTWIVVRTALEVFTDDAGRRLLEVDGASRFVEETVAAENVQLTEQRLRQAAGQDLPASELVYEAVDPEGGGGERRYFLLQAFRHWQYWSFLPALTAIVLCWMTKEPLSALLAGILVGALLIGKYDLLGEILIPAIGTETAATILVLYLWLLGGLMGIWANTGASRAFADTMSRRFVRGPRSAKFVAWLLGVVFFQGGTVSSVLVGTTVRPLADEQRVSHEELSLIVDSTSSPIAVLLAFNAWPFYVQAFLGVAGVTYLATEDDRVAFFFRSVPLSFYAWFSVFFTLLVALEKHPLLPKKLRVARERARKTGELNAPDAEPLAGVELEKEPVPPGYTPHVLDFVLPLVLLLVVAIGTYVWLGSPKVLWAFGAALALSAGMAWLKGMAFKTIVESILEGQKSVILGSVILLLAITIGGLSQEVGGGRYLVELLGGLEWYWLLPAMAFLISIVIAFSTGSSFATFAVTLPLVMPLAHAVATSQGLANPELFVSICFAASLNGGVFGDQCSPISDTTILSSICTGADLMDHVTTQIPVAGQAALLAVGCWTALAVFCA